MRVHGHHILTSITWISALGPISTNGIVFLYTHLLMSCPLQGNVNCAEQRSFHIVLAVSQQDPVLLDGISAEDLTCFTMPEWRPVQNWNTSEWEMCGWVRNVRVCACICFCDLVLIKMKILSKKSSESFAYIQHICTSYQKKYDVLVWCA